MYIAKQNEDNKFNIYQPQTIQDIDGNDITILGEIVDTVDLDDLQLRDDDLDNQKADNQTKRDAINNATDGLDLKTQYNKLNTINKVL